MSVSKPSYAVGARNRVNRYRNRAVYDYDFIHDIVNTTAVVHVAFPPSLDEHENDFPALLPMIGVMAKYPGGDSDSDEKALDLYLHGYVSSRIMRLSAKAQEGDSDYGEQDFPLSVSATIVDGIVLSLTPNSHSYNYRSAILQGYGMPVADQEEKVWAMRQITNKVLDQRWENTRTPPTPTEMKTTNILRVQVESASGKHRHGQPHDDRHDLKDVDMRKNVWTGVVPIWEQRGVPVKGEEEEKTQVPAYITKVLEKMNAENKQKAMDGMKE